MPWMLLVHMSNKSGWHWVSCCSLRVCLGVHYNLLLSRDFKYSYKTSFLELNLTVEVSAREWVLLSGCFGGFFWFGYFLFVCCFFALFQPLFQDFLKNGIASEGETTLGLAASDCHNKTLSLHKCHLISAVTFFNFTEWYRLGELGGWIGYSMCFCLDFFLPPRVTTTPAEPKFSISAWTRWVWPSSSARRSSSSCRRSVKGCGSWCGCSKEAAPSPGIWKELGVFSPHKKLQVGCWLLVLGMHLFIRVARGTECRSRWRHCRQCAWWSGYGKWKKLGWCRREWMCGGNPVAVW